MKANYQHVQEYLSKAPQSKVLADLNLGFERNIKIWSNNHSRVKYDGVNGHTLSYYLKGGTGTSRIDHNRKTGSPGAYCIMPHGHYSDWEITSRFRFMHLYISDCELKRMFTETNDKDCRLMNVPDVTYAKNKAIENHMHRLLNAVIHKNVVSAEVALTELIQFVFEHHNMIKDCGTQMRGGLSSKTAKQTAEFIQENSHRVVRLRELAENACLSEFHFQRCFKITFGVSPNVWIENRRISKVKEMLRGDECIAGIAAINGYSCQSHLTRSFRKATGVTPATFRQQTR